MAFTNNIMIVRHRLLTELVKLWRDNELVEKIDRLPIELSPRRSKHAGRCCVHKERAVWKYKSLPLLGLDMEDEKDELSRRLCGTFQRRNDLYHRRRRSG